MVVNTLKSSDPKQNTSVSLAVEPFSTTTGIARENTIAQRARTIRSKDFNKLPTIHGRLKPGHDSTSGIAIFLKVFPAVSRSGKGVRATDLFNRPVLVSTDLDEIRWTAKALGLAKTRQMPYKPNQFGSYAFPLAKMGHSQRSPSLLLVLFTIFVICCSYAEASKSTAGLIQITLPDGETTYVEDNRKPSLYTSNFGDCLGDSVINVTRFDAAYYADNATVEFHLEGTTALTNESVMGE